MFSPSQQAFLLSWMAYDPGALIAKLAIPTLVVHGDADIQVDMADYQALQAGAGVEASRIIPGMNHVFKEINDPGDQMASYSDPSYPLHRQLIPALVEFLLDHKYDADFISLAISLIPIFPLKYRPSLFIFSTASCNSLAFASAIDLALL
jgi:hypothetical protein